MPAGVPHEQIREAQDRSWTARLLEILVDPGVPEAEREETSRTLDGLEDPRAEAPLGRILGDRSRPPLLREAAGSILRSWGAVDRAELRRCHREGDRVEQRHALLAMDHGEADLVEPIARDPDHPLFREAILALEWGFQEPTFQALKIAALSHADPRVRQVAAEVLVADEPVAAEEALIGATHDADDAVAAAAADTLQYYRSRRALVRLGEMRLRGGAPGMLAEDSFEVVRWAFERAVQRAQGAAREALVGWMRPVWDLLVLERQGSGHDGLAVDEDPAPAARALVPIAAAELVAELSDPDGPWAEKKRRLGSADPATIEGPDRARLVGLLATHPDAGVRHEGASLLAAWDEQEALLALVDDPRFVVMKSAMFHLGRTTPSPAVARRALDHLRDPRAAGTHAYETLLTYVAHAPPAEAVPLLYRLVGDDDRESVRYHAVRALVKLGATREIARLLPLLAAPPDVTWGVHLALLDACERLDLPPRGLDFLRRADDVDVQAALARLGAR